MIKCAISWKLLVVERNGPTFAPQGQVYSVHMVLLTLYLGKGNSQRKLK